MPRNPANPFDDVPETPSRSSPFGDTEPEEDLARSAARVEEAARRIRMLRTQLGAEGLTLAGTRALIEELSAALDATARGLRWLERESGR